MKEFNKTPYYIYIAIGIMYVLIKIIFVSLDQLPVAAIAHGSIPAILTVIAGILSLTEYRKDVDKRIWHWINIVFAFLVFTITPIIYVFKDGGRIMVIGRTTSCIDNLRMLSNNTICNCYYSISEKEYN